VDVNWCCLPAEYRSIFRLNTDVFSNDVSMYLPGKYRCFSDQALMFLQRSIDVLSNSAIVVADRVVEHHDE
jgi:hypothetical protein